MEQEGKVDRELQALQDSDRQRIVRDVNKILQRQGIQTFSWEDRSWFNKTMAVAGMSVGATHAVTDGILSMIGSIVPGSDAFEEGYDYGYAIVSRTQESWFSKAKAKANEVGDKVTSMSPLPSREKTEANATSQEAAPAGA